MSKPNVKVEQWRLIQNPYAENEIFLIGKIIDHPTYGTYLGRTGVIVSYNEEEKYAESHNTRYILGESEDDRIKKLIQTKDLENTLQTEEVKETIEKEFEKIREESEVE